ncbi:hypothetical protein CEXT_22011 [Caerostris extrusa]|uniref:Uncharacterized protein n=1 Tax=Caerostris extrusa TaxID=172846 RepID=A0AAV4MJG3_CAEEX|nr:hypothetical protein CEXT_22011 [Caerostris extrusa]
MYLPSFGAEHFPQEAEQIASVTHSLVAALTPDCFPTQRPAWTRWTDTRVGRTRRRRLWSRAWTDFRFPSISASLSSVMGGQSKY